MELKPCPFCGGEAMQLNNTPSSYYYIECRNCSMRTSDHYQYFDAIDLWNTRHEPKVVGCASCFGTGVLMQSGAAIAYCSCKDGELKQKKTVTMWQPVYKATDKAMNPFYTNGDLYEYKNQNTLGYNLFGWLKRDVELID